MGRTSTGRLSACRTDIFFFEFEGYGDQKEEVVCGFIYGEGRPKVQLL